ncbi:glycoside hydrolase family 3 C-terminal domain-containing protein [Thalassotalea sp. PLHSN55]|uniref:glycoside hydrolase family 3 C-terminal domain-containing protein n=1 Tax=Thalassotalea sp. PLHSN55 TaxID=3435888 RepID=UPI003F829628
MKKSYGKILVTLLSVLVVNACVQKSDTTSEKMVSSDYVQTKAQRLASVEQKVESLLAKLTLKEKVSLVHASGKFHVNAIERLGIPELWLSDGPHGVRHQIQRHSWDSAGWTDDDSTYLPHLTTVAASWDKNIATLHGTVLGREARDRKKDIILGPGVNLARLPLYGRNFEYMGEDPFLAAQLVVPEVIAIQNQDVAANVKHFALNTQELNRIGVNAKPDERTLREVYLPAFEAAVKQANVYSVMGAYNQYYGTNANQSKHLVKDILKGEWGFDGVLLTDWNVDINTFDAAMHGLDLEMGTKVDDYNDYFLAQPFLAQIEQGKIPEAVLDDKVRRILRLQLRVGLMDENRLAGARNTDEHRQIARDIASAGVVLLKNTDQVLPLDIKQVKNVLVIGPNADKKHGQGGGSSEVKSAYEITPLQGLKNKLAGKANITVMRARSNNLVPIAADYIASRHWTGTPAWQFAMFADANRTQQLNEDWQVNAHYQATQTQHDEFVTMSADIKPLKSGIHQLKLALDGEITLTVDGKKIAHFSGENGELKTFDLELNAEQIYQFTLDYNGQGNFTLGWDAPGDLFTSEAEYLAAAKTADAVIYIGGLSHGDDREAIDRKDMRLPGSQDEIISKLLAVNNNTVVLMVAGSAVEMPWAEQVKALVWGWYGGMEAGNAFADILFGDVNPSGKMPITLPKKLADTAPIALNDYNAVESLYSEGVFIGYRWFEQQQIAPNFVFGHGLSYSEFIYSDIEFSADKLAAGETLTVSATITNTSNVAGAEVVQLYLHDIVASVERPVKELKGFEKVFLQAKESKKISITLSQRDLSFWHTQNNNWHAEKGVFEVQLGSSLSDIRLTKCFNYQG